MEENEDIGIICRQTTYTEEEAKEQLSIHNGDVVKVLEAFHGIKKDTTPVLKTSLNQAIYSEIRNFMSQCAEPDSKALPHK
jgi:hypothetical protein